MLRENLIPEKSKKKEIHVLFCFVVLKNSKSLIS